MTRSLQNLDGHKRAYLLLRANASEKMGTGHLIIERFAQQQISVIDGFSPNFLRPVSR